MEKSLNRLRQNLRGRRKLSLPMLNGKNELPSDLKRSLGLSDKGVSDSFRPKPFISGFVIMTAEEKERDDDSDEDEVFPDSLEMFEPGSRRERMRSRSVCEPSKIRPEVLQRIHGGEHRYTTRSATDLLEREESDSETLERPVNDFDLREQLPGSYSTGDLFSSFVGNAISLPTLVPTPKKEWCEQQPTDGSPSLKPERRPVKLKRRKAYYRSKREGRSKSLTHIDALDQAMQVRRDDSVESSRSEYDTPSTIRLGLPSPSGSYISGLSTNSYSTDVTSRRRRLSNAFKVQSSEFFSVIFDCGEETGTEEFVAAIRGTSLCDALSSLCERRGLDISNVSVYLDSSKTPLALNTTETFWLGGKHLRIKYCIQTARSPTQRLDAKHLKNVPAVVKNWENQAKSHRGSAKSSRLLSGATSMDDPPDPGILTAVNTLYSSSPAGSNDGSLKSTRSLKQSNRWSGLFSSASKETKMDVLADQLNEYGRNGIPRLAASEVDDEKFFLEEDWRDIVSDWSVLNERLQQQQNAVWELVTTEAAYIKTLRVITDLFAACLQSLQSCHILNEIDSERLFANIGEIVDSHLDFWANYVRPMVEEARFGRGPLNPITMQEGMLKFDEIFHPYTRYCLEQSQCQSYCRDRDHDSELFKAYLAWCETQRDCARLRLTDLLVKPMQRLTKYPLLLKAIMKKTDPDDQKLIVSNMIFHVEGFVSQVNAAMRTKQEHERLSGIIARIDSYDAVESKDEEIDKVLRQHSVLDLTRPMPSCPEHMRRNLLAEADLKMKDSSSSKFDVHIVLFTDMLLICKSVSKKAERMKIIRPPFFVDRLLVTELSRDPTALGLVYLNELSVAVGAFTLHCQDAKTTKAWIENIKKAQEHYSEAKTSFEPFIVDYDDDEYEYNSGHLVISRSPRGSSRGSRGSSLVHSHSGSMENEVYIPRLPSFEAVEGPKCSSSSSEEVSSGLQESGRRETLSPRNSRKHLLTTRLSPNTLTVQVPHVTVVPSGQSLPNLLSFTVPIPQQSLSVRVPPHRGVSYPPPSPKGLMRALPVPQSRNPPLVKTRRVGGSMVDEGQLVEALNPEVIGKQEATVLRLPPSGIEVLPDDLIEEVGLSEEDLSLAKSMPGAAAFAKRLARNGEGRRYHTAGAVEDLKRQDAKDSSIQKRFSWNYGQHLHTSPPNQSLAPSSTGLADSMISFSSSGVSSSASLHLSATSEGEDFETTSQGYVRLNEVTNPNYRFTKLLSPSSVARPTLPPPLPPTTSSREESKQSVEPPINKEPNSEANKFRLEVAEICEGISSVQITVSGSDQKSRRDFIRLKDLLLTDCSVEASYPEILHLQGELVIKSIEFH